MWCYMKDSCKELLEVMKTLKDGYQTWSSDWQNGEWRCRSDYICRDDKTEQRVIVMQVPRQIALVAEFLLELFHRLLLLKFSYILDL